MRIKDFDWDERNIGHIGRHGVEPEETEEAFVEKGLILRAGGERYLLLGRSSAGRYLVVVFERGKSVARVITARDMTASERKRYRGGSN